MRKNSQSRPAHTHNPERNERIADEKENVVVKKQESDHRDSVDDGQFEERGEVEGKGKNSDSDEEEDEIEIDEVKLQASRKGRRNSLMRGCLLYTSPSPRDLSTSRMPSSA